MYRVVLYSDAWKSYQHLGKSDRVVFERIREALKWLKVDPFVGKPLRDALKGCLSLRVGVYRIIYRVVKEEICVYILEIGHRREVYR